MADLTEYAALDAEGVIGETDKAWNVKLKNGKKGWWPKSQCRFVGDTLWVPKWLLEKKENENG